MVIDMKISNTKLQLKFFTFLELMIIISILGILISLLLPSLRKAKEASHRAVCLSNQAQLYRTTSLFSQDNNMKIPRGAMNDGGTTYETSAFTIYRLLKYNGISDEVSEIGIDNHNEYDAIFQKYTFHQCPSFSNDYSLTYVVNSMNFEKAADDEVKEMHHAPSKGFDFFLSPDNPNKTFLFGELNSSSASIAPGTFTNHNIWKYEDLPYNEFGAIQLGGRMLGTESPEHQSKGIVMFFDGHGMIYSKNNKSIFTKEFINGIEN